MNITCKMCQGDGAYRGFQCPRCFGSGVVPIFSPLMWVLIMIILFLFSIINFYTAPFGPTF